MLQLKEAEPEAFAAVVGSGLRQILPGMSSFWHPYLEQARARGEVRADLDIAARRGVGAAHCHLARDDSRATPSTPTTRREYVHSSPISW